MSYKIKSLFYFICFAVSAILYHSLEPKLEDEPSARTMDTPKTDLEKTDSKNNLTLLSYTEE